MKTTKNLYVGLDPGVNNTWVSVLNDKTEIVLSEFVGFKSYYYREKAQAMGTKAWVKVQSDQFKAILAKLAKDFPKAKIHIAIEVPQVNLQSCYMESMKLLYIYNVLVFCGVYAKNVEWCGGVNTNIYKKLINQRIQIKTKLRKIIAINWANNIFHLEINDHNQADSLAISFFIRHYLPNLKRTGFFINRVRETKIRKNLL